MLCGANAPTLPIFFLNDIISEGEYSGSSKTNLEVVARSKNYSEKREQSANILYALLFLLLKTAFVNDPCATPPYCPAGPPTQGRKQGKSANGPPTAPRAALPLPGRPAAPIFLLLVLENPAPLLLQYPFLYLLLSWENWSDSLLGHLTSYDVPWLKALQGLCICM